MIKELSAVFIALSLTSCNCYSELFRKTTSNLEDSPGVIDDPDPILKSPVLKSGKNVFFETNNFSLNSEAKKVLDEKIIPDLKGKRVVIEGNADERGSAVYNKALGKRRANAVKDYLVKNGVNSSKITTLSYGESKPINLGHDEEAWAENRRVVTIAIKQK